MCQNAILRIHNQGHCGSCWAFGGLASLDARMCIASNGTWNAPTDILSRLQATSCASVSHYPGHDGCQGGFPHWPMEYMANHGLASTSCLPYYIHGEGVEHFQHQDAAPPCMTHCQGGYGSALADDRFHSEGAGNYDHYANVHGDATMMASIRAAIYSDGPVAFAFKATHAFMGYTSGVFSGCDGSERANHAVYAYGWGVEASEEGEPVEFVRASNSWGENWGAGGHFWIHPLCVVDVTVPGHIEATVVTHPVGPVDLTVPRDAHNPRWPWPQPDECPTQSDGCVTDIEGNASYAVNEKCVSSALNGKKIRVKEFDLEFGYDILTVNGQMFSGKDGYGFNKELLESLTVDEAGIQFASDFSVSQSGFRLCPA